MVLVGYDEAPKELEEIQQEWKRKADAFGDAGSCVVGAGFQFEYIGKMYFMPPISKWQGSVSWEKSRKEIGQKLKEVGATQIRYEWGEIE